MPDADTIICPNILVPQAKATGARVIAAIHRDEKPSSEADKVIFCAEWLQKQYPVNVPSMVFRPINRLKPKAKREPSRVLGAINLTHKKGAAMLRHYFGELVVLNKSGVRGHEVIAGYQHPQAFYDQIGIFCLPSLTEGYSTVCLEALSQSLPIIATDIPGIREVVGDACHYVNNLTDIHNAVAHIMANYKRYSLQSWARWLEIKDLNNVEQLKKFCL